MIERKKHILLVDDEVNLTTVLADFLRSHNYKVTTLSHPDRVLEAFAGSHVDLCLMDLNLPVHSGFDLLRKLRKAYALPIIILTSRSQKEDILRAYELGCDDYITKPFSMDIVLCRIQAVLRRCEAPTKKQPTTYQLGSLTFDAQRHLLGDQHLTARESEILLLLFQQEGQLVDRHLILTSVWSQDSHFASRSLAVFITRLRHLLEPTPYTILGVTGKGYKIVRSE